MLLTHNLDKNISMIKSKLKVGESFDLLERVIKVHGYKFYLYYIDGFVKDTSFEYVRRDMYNLKKEDFDKIHNATDLIEMAISSVETDIYNDVDEIITQVLSGKTALIGKDFDEAIIFDFRTYPLRGVDEPDKEKVLRGAHDGFVELIISNTGLIRRRIRDTDLVFEMHSVGSISKTDVAIGFLESKVNRKTLDTIRSYIENLDIKSLTLGDQSLIEAIKNKSVLNPYPKVRYTERPDVAAAQIIEGDVIIIIDNTPSVLIIPSTIFSFLQSVDDYYLPVFTGNYLKIVRMIVLIFNLFLTPIYVLLTDNPQWINGGSLSFILPSDPVTIPIFLQFLVMEFAVDGLKIASLNTPDTLGTSLSIIGGLILGDFAVKTGWFIPQTIFYMAVVALSSFIQPSIEFSFALKFSRMILLLLTGLFGLWGFIVAFVINIVIICSTKTFAGEPYLYPLIPFNKNALKHVLFRCKKDVGNSHRH